MDTLSNPKRDLNDIKWDLKELKTIMLDMHNRDDNRWSRVDKLMAFLQDLWQEMVDHDKGNSQVQHVYTEPRLNPGF
jgi:hypothetical protein